MEGADQGLPQDRRKSPEDDRYLGGGSCAGPFLARRQPCYDL